MAFKDIDFNDLKLGQTLDEEVDFLEKPIKVVALSYTLQGKDGTQMELKYKTDDYIDNEEEDLD